MTETVATLPALRYLQPLREGGSLPAVVATPDGPFVVKFRGAGQGPLSLVAEIIAARAAERIGLPVPELALVDVAEEFGRSEPDPEIQDLLRASRGLNVGLRYLDGAFNFALSPAGDLIDADFAARLVWLDAFLINPDRTVRNPNLLIWDRRPWLIDHGSALYMHHDWAKVSAARTRAAFPLIEAHVLLSVAAPVGDVDAALAARFDDDALENIVAAVPATLLGAGDEAEAERARARYVDWMRTRLAAPRAFAAAADEARERVLAAPPMRLEARR